MATVNVHSALAPMGIRICSRILLLLLLNADLRLPAQQSELGRLPLSQVRAKAEAGDAQSQFELATAFFRGDSGVKKDEAEAVKWLRRAAEQNLPVAQNDLALCFQNGRGVVRDALE